MTTTAMVRGRFAPSPTGELHFGTARTALVAWLHARAAGGQFVMRLEDLDTARVVPGAAERMLDDLGWLGLDWDEGPFAQSARGAHYDEALARLDRAGRIFSCVCSRADLVAAASRSASAPHAGEDGPRYTGTCRDRRRDEPAPAGRAASLRFRVDDAPVTFRDLLHGEVTQDVGAVVGDFVIRRGDGTPAYQLAVVVDDAAMGITHVVRGDDLLGSTPRQILLYRALGHPVPEFLHVPLVLDADGVRLAKRHAGLSIAGLRAAGRSAPEVCGWLAATLGLAARATPVTPQQLVTGFDAARLVATPTRLPVA